MDALSQLIASMDMIGDQESTIEKGQNLEEKASESESMNSIGFAMEEQRKTQKGQQQFNDGRRSSMSAMYHGSTNGHIDSDINVIDDVLGDMEFNAYDEPVGVTSASESSNDVDDSSGTDNEADDLNDETHGNSNNNSNDFDFKLARRGSTTSSFDRRNGSFSAAAYSRSVPIDVPIPSLGRRNSRLLDYEEQVNKLENIQEDIYTKIVRDSKNAITDGTEILGQLPNNNSRSLASLLVNQTLVNQTLDKDSSPGSDEPTGGLGNIEEDEYSKIVRDAKNAIKNHQSGEMIFDQIPSNNLMKPHSSSNPAEDTSTYTAN